MVEIKKMAVELRESTGKRRNRRLRASGKIPAVLYGHKKDNVSLVVAADEVEAVLRHGSRFVALTGALNERAFIKECQWDTWGKVVLHIDFTRVNEHERIRMSVPVELRGEAPGVRDGGVVKQVLHEMEIECEPANAPERIDVNINHLGFEQAVHVADLTMPEGVTALIDPATLVVECIEVIEKEETPEDGATGAEPEVIGRKKADEEEEKE